MRSVVRLADPATGSLAGSVLIGLGLTLLVYAAGMHLDLVPGGRVTVPPPVALERTRTDSQPTDRSSSSIEVSGAQPQTSGSQSLASSVPDLAEPAASLVAPPALAESAASLVAPPVLAETVDPLELDLSPVAPAPESIADPSVYASPMVPGDAADRPFSGSRPPPGTAVRLRIPAIKVDTRVVSAGVVANRRGELEWQTVPFVAAHYVATGLVGARGNAVISGHVVTLQEGNVFRNLYKLEFGNLVQVDTDEGTFTYKVEDIQLVPPNAVDVMDPTQDPRLTLITCGGQYNPRTMEFSDRLVIGATLVDWDRHLAS